MPIVNIKSTYFPSSTFLCIFTLSLPLLISQTHTHCTDSYVNPFFFIILHLIASKNSTKPDYGKISPTVSGEGVIAATYVTHTSLTICG